MEGHQARGRSDSRSNEGASTSTESDSLNATEVSNGDERRPAPSCQQLVARYELKKAEVVWHKNRLATRLAVMWAGVLLAGLWIMTPTVGHFLMFLGAAMSVLLTALEANDLASGIDKIDTMEDISTDGAGGGETCRQNSAPSSGEQPLHLAPAAEQGRTERFRVAQPGVLPGPRQPAETRSRTQQGEVDCHIEDIQERCEMPPCNEYGYLASRRRRPVKLASGLVQGEAFSWVGLGSLGQQLPSAPLPPIDELQVASLA